MAARLTTDPEIPLRDTSHLTPARPYLDLDQPLLQSGFTAWLLEAHLACMQAQWDQHGTQGWRMWVAAPWN